MTQTSLTTDAVRMLSILAKPGEKALVVRARHGDGKSALLESARRHSEWPSRLVRLNPAEQHWRLSGLVAILSSIPNAPIRAFARRLSALDDPERDRLAMAVLHQLSALDSPLLLLVDDADIMDPESAEVLAYVLGRLGGGQLRAVVTTSAEESCCPFAGLASFVQSPATVNSVADALSHEFGQGVSADVALIVARSADLSVGQAIAMVELLAPEQRVGAAALTFPLPTERATGGGIDPTLTDLSAEDLEVLRHLAAAPSVYVSALAQLAHISTSLPGLRSRGLAVTSGSRSWVAKASMRSAIYWEAPAEDRAAIHRRLHDLSDDDPWALAWHAFHLSPGPPEAFRVAQVAVLAARAGHIQDGIEYAEAALTGSAHDPTTALAMGELAYALFTSGEFRLALRYLRFAEMYPADALSDIRNVGVHLGLGFLSQQKTLGPLLDDIVQRYAGEHTDKVVRLLLIHSYYQVERWELPAARATINRAVDVSAGSFPELAHITEVYARLVDAASGDLEADDALPGANVRDHTSLLAHARTLTYLERYEEARECLEALLVGSDGVQPLWIHTAGILAVDNDLRSGSFHIACQRAQKVFAHPSEAHRAPRLWMESIVLRTQGDEETANRRLRQLREFSGGANPALTVKRLVGTADLSLHRGRWPPACEAYGLALRHVGDDLPPQMARLHPGLIESSWWMGDLDGAARHLAHFEELVKRHPSRWSSHPLARCRALVADPAEVTHHLLRVLEEPSMPDQMFERGRTLTTLAAVTEDPDQRQRAARAAVALFEEIGLPDWSAALARRLRLPSDSEGSSPALGLNMTSDTERLLALVAEGHTNSQIAELLHVSRRTVEARLTALFRAFGVSSRVELNAVRRPPA